MNPPSYEETCEAIEDGRFSDWPEAMQEAGLQALAPLPAILPPKNQTPNRPGDYGSALHFCAHRGHLDQIAPKLLTEENLLSADKDGWTPVHYAAANGHLHQIPASLLTEKTLTTPDNAQITPLHWAAAYGQLELLPPGILTEKLLLIKDLEGARPLDWAATHGSIDQIPLKLSAHLLKPLLKKKTCHEDSKTWIQKAIRKKEIQKCLQNCNHPDL